MCVLVQLMCVPHIKLLPSFVLLMYHFIIYQYIIYVLSLSSMNNPKELHVTELSPRAHLQLRKRLLVAADLGQVGCLFLSTHFMQPTRSQTLDGGAGT